MDSIHIFWGPDTAFEQELDGINPITYLQDVLSYIGRTEVAIAGVPPKENDTQPLKVENLIIYTDDYGALREWALLGFTKNVLENLKVHINNIWINNPPQRIYDDICRNNDENIIIENHRTYPGFKNDSLKTMVSTYTQNIIGQDHVIKYVVTALYSLKHQKRKRPITLLFIGDSGVGKTETAKFIGKCLGQEMVRVQFSMQQTAHAYQFIFGAEHSENSLARELIRRESNVILLDEFDKVSPSFYNAFYQMFDEGFFVDANYKVNISKSIIICTTNYLSEEEAETQLGTPIFSRFSKVIRFNPISVDDRIRIASRYYKEVISTLEEEDKNLIGECKIVDDFIAYIKQGSYKNMRMLKNDIEDAVNYHVLKAQGILP